MTNNKHTIGTLQFEIETYNEKHATEIQQRVSGLGKKEIPEMLEESLTGVGMNHSVTIIDKLELDLGEISTEDFESNFLALFGNRFSDILSEIQFNVQSGKESGVRTLDKQNSERGILQYFLLTGWIPWYSEGSSIDLERIFTQLVDAKSEAFIQFITDHIYDENFVKRLVYQFPEKLVMQLIQLATEIILEENLQFTKLIESVLAGIPSLKARAEFQEQLVLITLIETLFMLKSKPGAIFEELLLINLSKKLGIDIKELMQHLTSQIIKVKNKAPDKITSEFKSKIQLLSKKNAFGDLQLTNLEKEISNFKKEKDKTVPSEVEEAPKSYYVSNAGLVLIHPFLPELFRKTNLILNNEFVDEQAIHKAIHLTQYAVFGNLARPEHLLILNKLLCGYPLENTIPIRIALSKAEKAETTKMVNALIKHWSALKNTTVKGFRSSFLKRNGLLKKEDNGWRLFVEPESYDVLLDRIPWNYKIIKLPWMEKIIETEW